MTERKTNRKNRGNLKREKIQVLINKNRYREEIKKGSNETQKI